MKMFMNPFNARRVTTLVVLLVLSMQLTFAQRLAGKWKCTKETLQEMSFNFTDMKAKCSFKKDGTFTVVIKGSSMKGHKYTPYRYMSAEARGRYVLNGNTITSTIDAKDIKVGVGTDMEDPTLDESIMDKRDVRGNRTVWISANRRYENELFTDEVQEQTVKEKILELWTWNGLPVSFDGSDGINIGNLIGLTKK